MSKVVAWLETSIFGAGLVIFIFLFGNARLMTFKASGSMPSFTAGYVVVTALLVGTLGTVVAMSLGVELPESKSTKQLRLRFKWIGEIAVPSTPETVQTFIGASYLISYVVLGIIAVALWVLKPADVVPEFIKNLASVMISLIVAIINKVFPVIK